MHPAVLLSPLSPLNPLSGGRRHLKHRQKARWVGFNIHETVVSDNPRNVQTLKGNLIHWLYNSHEESIEKMNKYTTLLAYEYHKKGIKSNARKIMINPLWRFFHSFFLKGGFLDGFDGYVVSRFLSYTCFLKYVKLKRLYSKDRDFKLQKIPRNKIVELKSDIKTSFPLAIGFDAKRAFYNHSGLGNYSRNLLHALNKTHPENRYYLLDRKSVV